MFKWSGRGALNHLNRDGLSRWAWQVRQPYRVGQEQLLLHGGARCIVVVVAQCMVTQCTVHIQGWSASNCYSKYRTAATYSDLVDLRATSSRQQLVAVLEQAGWAALNYC